MVYPIHYLQEEFYGILCNDPEMQLFFKNEPVDGICYLSTYDPSNIWVTIPFLHLLGYTPHDFQGQVLEWRRIIYPPDEQNFMDIIEGNQADNKKISRVTNMSFFHKDGSIIQVALKYYSLKESASFIGVVKKINVNTLCRSLNGMSFNMVIHLLNNFFILDSSFRFVNFLYKLEESSQINSINYILGKNFNEIGFPEGVCLSIKTVLENAVEFKSKQEHDFMLTINNVEEWFKLIVTVWDPIKKDSRLICVINQITKQKQEEFKRSIHFKALENSIDGIALLSTEGFCTYVNTSYAKMLDMQPDEIIGKHWRMYLSSREVQKFDKEILPLLYSTGTYVGSIYARHKNGLLIPISLSLSISPDNGVICILRDMTLIEEMKEQIKEKEHLLQLLSQKNSQ